jgi:hypothetical protein
MSEPAVCHEWLDAYMVTGVAGGTPAAPSLTSAGGSVSGTQADPGAGPPHGQGGPRGWSAPVDEASEKRIQ